MGVDVIPLSVIVNGHSYLDLEELDGPSLIEIINQGHFPTTSQPSVGETLEVFQKYAHEEIFYITMADGISGTYQNARAARKMMECPDAIHILNSRTLCGPQRYLVEKAIVLAQHGKSPLEIIQALQASQNSSRDVYKRQSLGRPCHTGYCFAAGYPHDTGNSKGYPHDPPWRYPPPRGRCGGFKRP